jgi:uncharacterized protein (TIGR02246 family)
VLKRARVKIMEKVEAEIMQVLHAWSKAVERNDFETLKSLMADGLIHTAPTGALYTKEQVLEGLVSAPDMSYDSVDVDDVRVSAYGDIAIANGLTAMKARYDGQEVVGRFRFTDVFHKQDGRWRIVATHTTAIAGLTA